MKEEAIRFGGAAALVGILTHASEGDGRIGHPAAILLNDGLVHRVGPNRISVLLARHLAKQGVPAFRFDFSGIGDSEVRQDDLPFDQSFVLETQEAMTLLSKRWGCDGFVLIGMCSGGLRALRVARVDPRVAGVVLINPQPYHQENSDRVTSYLRRRRGRNFPLRVALSDPRRWTRALTGRMHYRELLRIIGFKLTAGFTPNIIGSPVADRLAQDFRMVTQRGCHVLLVFSEGNPGLEYLRMTIGQELREMCETAAMAVEVVPGADHNFTLLWNQDALLDVVERWLATTLTCTPTERGAEGQ